MKTVVNAPIVLNVCDSLQEAKDVLSQLMPDELLDLAEAYVAEATIVAANGAVIGHNEISRAYVEGTISSGTVLKIGEGQFFPIVHATGLVITTSIESIEEVKSALEDIEDADESDQPDTIAKMIGFFSDEGKVALQDIAEDENSDYRETAQVVMDAMADAEAEAVAEETEPVAE